MKKKNNKKGGVVKFNYISNNSNSNGNNDEGEKKDVEGGDVGVNGDGIGGFGGSFNGDGGGGDENKDDDKKEDEKREEGMVEEKVEEKIEEVLLFFEDDLVGIGFKKKKKGVVEFEFLVVEDLKKFIDFGLVVVLVGFIFDFFLNIKMNGNCDLFWKEEFKLV